MILATIWLFPPWTAFIQPMSRQGYSLALPAYAMNTYYHFAFGNPEGWTSGVVLCVDWGKLLLSSAPVVFVVAATFITAGTANPS